MHRFVFGFLSALFGGALFLAGRVSIPTLLEEASQYASRVDSAASVTFATNFIVYAILVLLIVIVGYWISMMLTSILQLFEPVSVPYSDGRIAISGPSQELTLKQRNKAAREHHFSKHAKLGFALGYSITIAVTVWAFWSVFSG